MGHKSYSYIISYKWDELPTCKWTLLNIYYYFYYIQWGLERVHNWATSLLVYTPSQCSLNQQTKRGTTLFCRKQVDFLQSLMTSKQKETHMHANVQSQHKISITIHKTCVILNHQTTLANSSYTQSKEYKLPNT